MHARMHTCMHTYVHARGAHEDAIFSEELNFGAGRHATCCHTECLAKQVITVGAMSPSKSAPQARPASSGADATPPPLLDSRTETAVGTPREPSNAAQCAAIGQPFDDTPPLAPAPPNATANRWPRSAADGSLAAHGSVRYGTTARGTPLMQLAWRADSYNTLHVPLHRFGRCTGRTESCIGLHTSCPPPPPPFGVVLASKTASRRAAAHRRRKGKAPG